MDFERDYWQGSADHLRKIGVKAPICGTNWKGGGFTTRMHMRNQAELDYIDRNGYWDHPQGEGNDRWRISRRQFSNLPMIQAATAGEDPQQENNVGNLVLSKAWALDVNGQRTASAPIQAESGRVMLELDRKHATMYYELTAKPSK